MTDQPEPFEVKRSIRTTVPAYEMSAIAKRDLIRDMLASGALVAGVDYGTVGTTDKKTLLKPGAEKLCTEFALAPRFNAVSIIEDFERGLFHYRYECNLYDIESGLLVSSGIGSCNSMESKYGFRWVADAAVPKNLDKSTLRSREGAVTEPEFGIERADTKDPKYGKPKEYWEAFREAIDAGTAIRGEKINKNNKPYTTWTIGGTEYAVPNDDIFSLVNTLDKMGCKRSFIASTLIGCNASEFFTQDIEDMPGFDVHVIDPDADPAAGTPLAKVDAPTEKPILGAAVSDLVKWAEGNGKVLADVRKALGVAEPNKIGTTWRGTLDEAKAVCTAAWADAEAF